MQSAIDFKDSDIIEALRAKFKFHVSQAEIHTIQAKRYETALQAFGGEQWSDYPKIVSELPSKSEKDKAPVKSVKRKKNFEDIVIELLSDGIPRTTKLLMEKYNELGLKKYDLKDFSSKMSIRAKDSGNFKNFKIDKYPNDSKFWWGLKDWYDGEVLRDEYIDKIEKAMG